MTQGITTMQGLTIGIDLGDRYRHYPCVVRFSGPVRRCGTGATTVAIFLGIQPMNQRIVENPTPPRPHSWFRRAREHVFQLGCLMLVPVDPGGHR